VVYLHKLMLLALGVSLLLTQALLAQADPLDSAKGAVRKKDYPAAINLLVGYLNANAATVGHPKVEEAKRILLQVTRTHSAALHRAGKPMEAAQVLLDAAAVAAVREHSSALQDEARTLLHGAYEAAASSKSAASALAIADAFAMYFPEDPPLITPRQRLRLELENLGAEKNARPAYVLREARRLKQAGVTDEQLQAAGIIESELVARYAEELAARGWALQAASFAQAELLTVEPSSTIYERLAKVAEQALASHVDACLQLGNARMVADAVALYLDPTNTAADPTRRTRYEAAAQRATEKLEPKKLEFSGKFVEGTGTWMDDGSGFEINGVIQLGNGKNNRGGEWKEAKVFIQPGTMIEGGTLRVSHGRLEIQGTAARPVILKDITFECEYTATIAASYAVFIDCKFRKAGNWFFNNGFSSKWQLTDCMLVRSNFANLKKVDYGIKFQRCTFVQCDLPDRSMTDDATRDNSSLFRHGWNTIANCQFYDSTLHPSLLWANGQSAFIDCRFGGESTYASTQPLRVQLFTVADNSGFAAEAVARTVAKGAGNVEYHATVIDPSRLKVSPLWRLVPALADQIEAPAPWVLP